MTQPEYWRRFIDAEGLAKLRVSIPETDDVSGVGAEIYWFDDEASREERDDFYPGLVVKKDGFVPVGGCELGSGDPYFICEKDGEGGPLYRIYHDAVGHEDYDRASSVAVVLPDYRLLARYKK